MSDLPPISSYVYSVTVGVGPTLLTMHGGLGLDHTLFRPWLDPLGEECRLVYYDHRGHGRSPRLASFEGCSHATWADDGDALRASLDVPRFIVLGHSYGGFLALEYALRYPDRLAGLVLSNTAPAMHHGEVVLANAERRGGPKMLERVRRLLTEPLPGDEAMAEAFAEVLPLYFHRYDPDIGARMLTDLQPCAAAFNHGNARCLPDYDVRDRLGGIQVPTLVLSSADDWIMPVEHGGDVLAKGIPGACHVVFERSGHFPFIEEQEAYLAAVSGFISALDGERP